MLGGRAIRYEIRQVALGLLMIGLAGAALANLVCAVRYGAVFTSRGPDWAYFDTRPLSFIYSVVASTIMLPFGVLMGIVTIKGARDERRFFAKRRFRPRLVDPSRISHLQE